MRRAQHAPVPASTSSSARIGIELSSMHQRQLSSNPSGSSLPLSSRVHLQSCRRIARESTEQRRPPRLKVHDVDDLTQVDRESGVAKRHPVRYFLLGAMTTLNLFSASDHDKRAYAHCWRNDTITTSPPTQPKQHPVRGIFLRPTENALLRST